MDYSNANAALWNVIIQFGIIAVVILLSNLLRRKVSFIRNSLMPTAVLGGFILLIARSVGIIDFDTDFMEKLIYHGIALGFIAMSLRIPDKNTEEKGNLTAPKSGAIIVGSYLIQAIFGLGISIGLAYTVMPGMFKAAGILLPMGYGQGPGQANNVGSTYEAVGFVGGRSFGLSLAAAGYLCACIIGVIALNILAKKGKLKKASGGTDALGSVNVDKYQDEGEIPVSESVDKFSIQVALILLVYLVTYLLTWGITAALSAWLPAVGATLNTLLWGFNFIIGSALAILTRVILKNLKGFKLMTRQYQNNYLLSRISGFFFDAMIVAGIASINFQDLSGLWLPFALMAITGGIITWYFLVWVCREVYKGYFYEGLLSMYGMMTGTISSGVLLLREVDPEMKTTAANNLITGSSFAIIFGAPILVIIGMAWKSDVMAFVTLGLCVVYFILMMLFIFKVKIRKK
ncbi:MAG: sodium:glutamate symporter [Clostridiales bacterium]|nr:sodium:glutamate symporter [Clostridiales bacterium]